METVAPIPAYNLSEDQEKKLILREYRALLRALKPKLKPGDKELVRLAFEISAEAHKTMRRKSGEPYVLHPLAVARISVEEIGLGPTVLGLAVVGLLFCIPLILKIMRLFARPPSSGAGGETTKSVG